MNKSWLIGFSADVIWFPLMSKTQFFEDILMNPLDFKYITRLPFFLFLFKVLFAHMACHVAKVLLQ